MSYAYIPTGETRPPAVGEFYESEKELDVALAVTREAGITRGADEVTLYAVDKYIDQIRLKRIRTKDGYEYFETEAEARAFIITRAVLRCAKARELLSKEQARLKNCHKKFGEPKELSHDPLD